MNYGAMKHVVFILSLSEEERVEYMQDVDSAISDVVYMPHDTIEDGIMRVMAYREKMEEVGKKWSERR